MIENEVESRLLAFICVGWALFALMLSMVSEDSISDEMENEVESRLLDCIGWALS